MKFLPDVIMKARVAIVEEDIHLGDALTMYLQSEGIDTVLLKVPDVQAIRESLPDLILLGEEFQDTNGFVVCSKIREYPDTADVPVILISEEMTVKPQMGVKECPDDFVTKPFEMEYLMKKISRNVRIRHTN